jgi:hypothetical protein
MGRPINYKPEIFDKICARVSEGESLNKICKSNGFPTKTTFYKWLREHKTLNDQYARAKEDRADTYSDELIDIADELAGRGLLSSEKIQAARVRIDTRKWIASKLHPRNYGDRTALEHSGANGAPSIFFNLNKKED